ncbi:MULTISPECIES: SH3 domain-containing protein [Micromonospora]|uniref:SH3 domain-containing protein n=1 Tax=Micromonospora TaxID=1873 RepID=UPI0024A3949B|nr:SH3 domain-containing protein [Micromonospora sp. NBRC 107095]GLZ61879.1 hypothetical protein Misp05_54550 [Micromonospora sp. NBRC 107095]
MAGLGATLALVPAGPASAAAYTVTAWTRANVRALPDTSSAIVSSVAAGGRYPANCWLNGELVYDYGIEHDHWVQLQLSNGKRGYVHAIYLNGDNTGNVNTYCD